MKGRHHCSTGISYILMSLCFLILVYDGMALPGKQASMDGRKHILSRDFDSLNIEEIPSEVVLDINDDDTLQQLDDPNYVIVEDPNVTKRFLGRWRNRNWKLSQRQEKGDAMSVGKRFFGRWMNRNYILSKLEAERENRVGKRFLGRWRNRNYLLEKLNEE